ncbi:response regulator [Paenibacillus guangzhouensis]|uniref:response regulator n=1 Tax=Paenibacillus guangzhouensis TaxID=1473112 RepID=UPI001266A9B8|nr:response regulator [Paenibacillus guangzhouensis]
MKVILVDDEPLALSRLQKLLERVVSGVEIVASYSDPNEVTLGVLEHRPDVVFLDIQMPEIDGLELGMQIQTVVPGTEIVFVTGYDQYAVRAFELYAVDYIMKPVQLERLNQTVMRVMDKMNLKGTKETQDLNTPMVCCFEQIRFQLNAMKTQNVKWRTSKAQELFAYLLHHRKRVVSRNLLLELLWPDTPEDKAVQYLYTAIYHIRQTLKNYRMDSISIRIGELETGYRLDMGNAHVDTELWEKDLKQLGRLDADTVDSHEHVLKMYTGDYLGNYEYLWAEHERERLRMLWLYQIRRVSEFYEQQGLMDKAIRLIQDAQRIKPDEEDYYFLLMKLNHAIDNQVGVEEQFFLLKTRMESDMELPISEEIIRWYEQWCNNLI